MPQPEVALRFDLVLPLTWFRISPADGRGSPPEVMRPKFAAPPPASLAKSARCCAPPLGGFHITQVDSSS